MRNDDNRLVQERDFIQPLMNLEKNEKNDEQLTKTLEAMLKIFKYYKLKKQKGDGE